jgi:hypothetical protein
MSAVFSTGDRCLITHDIIIEGQPAFEYNEPVVVESVHPNPQSPSHQYVVFSPSFQKRFQLQDSDLTSQAPNSLETQPSSPTEEIAHPSRGGTSGSIVPDPTACLHQYSPSPDGPLHCRKCGHTLEVSKQHVAPNRPAEKQAPPKGPRGSKAASRPSDVLGKYSVQYLGGLPHLPKKKMSAIDMYLTSESFVFRSTMKWWTDMEIAYTDVTDFQVVKNVVGSVRAVLGGLDSRQLNQDNNIHISYRTPEGARMLRLEMQTGVTLMGAARKCRELDDYILSHGISEKFCRQTGPEGTDVKACPHCAETIKAAATKCKHCGSDLQAG